MPAKMRREARRGFRSYSAEAGKGLAGGLTNSDHPAFMNSSRYLFAFAFAALAAPAFSADVLTNWKEHCAKCHGDDGKGDTKTGKKLAIADLTDAAVQAKFTDDAAAKAMKEGLTDKAGKVTMKAVEGLTADDMTALVKFVRTLKK
jgi:cytochrome c553